MESYSFDGYAHKLNENELREDIARRHEQLKRFRDDIKITKSTGYAHIKFTAIPLTDEARQLSARDILIIADNGNLCFGGKCQRVKNCFIGRYNIDQPAQGRA